MRRPSDAMVTLHDLDQAVQERRRGDGRATMERLIKTEPYLAVYIEGLAAHLTNELKRPKDESKAPADALDRILVIVRAIEIGQYRLWHGSIDPSSPLGRMISPTGDPGGRQKK